jgi:hypothetical protein
MFERSDKYYRKMHKIIILEKKDCFPKSYFVYHICLYFSQSRKVYHSDVQIITNKNHKIRQFLYFNQLIKR